MGLGLGLVNASIEDPDSSVSSVFAISPSFTYFSDVARDQRVTGKFSYYDFTLKASSTEIGQSVTTISFAAIYEWRQRLQRNFKPWLGVGVAFNSDKASSRHTVDSDGFLAQRYQDLDNTGFALLLDASLDIELFETDLLLRGVYTTPLYDGFNGLEFTLAYLF